MLGALRVLVVEGVSDVWVEAIEVSVIGNVPRDSSPTPFPRSHRGGGF